jgi:hypothetical protein
MKNMVSLAFDCFYEMCGARLGSEYSVFRASGIRTVVKGLGVNVSVCGVYGNAP